MHSPNTRLIKDGILFRRMQTEFGFREHAHTADWELEVWAPDLAILFEQAALGMYALSGVILTPGSRQERTLSLHAADVESLLVRFLTELLWVAQEQRVGFDGFSIQVDDECDFHAELSGSSILSLDKEIKAVTFHNLAVKATEHGLRVNIVFDV